MKTDVLSAIAQKLNELTHQWAADEEKWTDAAWTLAVKKLIADQAYEYSFHPMCHGFDYAYEGEWMYDVTWLELENNENKRMISLPLVCESEWGFKEHQINTDFDKLLVAQAPHKIFLFQKKHTEHIYTEFERLRGRIEAFQSQLKSEKYLLAGFNSHDKGVFHFRTYERVENDVKELNS